MTTNSQAKPMAVNLSRRRALALLGATVASTTLSGVALGQDKPKRGGVLKISNHFNPSSLDPATGGSGSDHSYLYTLYDTLTEWDYDTLRVVPGLAESWRYKDST